MNESQVKAATAEKENILNLMSLAKKLGVTAKESNKAISQEIKQIN
jgi:phosphotransferase system IIB component